MTTVGPAKKLLRKAPMPHQPSPAVERINISLKKKILRLENEKTELKHLVAALKAENFRLQKKIAKLEATQVSELNRAKALEKVNDPHGDISAANKIRSMSEDELESEISKLARNGGCASG